MINDYQQYLNQVDLLIKDHLNKNDVSSKVKESSLYSI